MSSPGNKGIIPFPDTDDSGYGLARVRVVNQAGNPSNQPADPLSTYIAEGAATGFVIDTRSPTLTGLSPTPGTLVTPNSGQVTISFTTSQNIDPATLNDKTTQVIRLSDNTAVPIDAGSYVVTPLKDGPQGPDSSNSASYDLTASSAAIDAANNAAAPPYDFYYRSRVKIPGRGFPGTGPADVGAFEYAGTGGIAPGGTFTASSPPVVGGPATGTPPNVPIQIFPQSLTFGFSNALDPSTVKATDLVLSGTALEPGHRRIELLLD